MAAIARDVGVDDKTVASYFQILEDTLLGFFLESFSTSVRKRQVQAPKFYLFDLGVQRSLERTLRQAIVPGTFAFGRAFEHFVIAEMVRLNDTLKLDCRFSHLRTKDGVEIDLIVERPGEPPALGVPPGLGEPPGPEACAYRLTRRSGLRMASCTSHGAAVWRLSDSGRGAADITRSLPRLRTA